MKKLLIAALLTCLSLTASSQIITRARHFSAIPDTATSSSELATVTDNFNDVVNGTDIKSRGLWLRIMGSIKGGDNGDVYVDSASYTDIHLYYYDTTFSTNHSSEVDVYENGGNQGCAVRANADSNHYFYRLSSSGFQVGKYVDGVETVLGSDGTSSSMTVYNLRLEISGTTLTCYLNDAAHTALSGTADGTYTDSDISTGKPAITGWGDTSQYGGYIDNFEGKEL